jgi:ribosomal protein S18 acetylase RimI-like enzyme
MSESTTLSFIIRDGLADDIPLCLGLDHTYKTEFVWQMSVQDDHERLQVMFKTQRLPRAMDTDVPKDEIRLKSSIDDEQCFLVAANRDQPEVFGYLTLRSDPAHQIALVQDLVVARPYRRRHIGSRMLNAARRWAREHDLSRLTVEVATKNYPAIVFCQHAGLVFCGFNDHYFPNGDIAVFFTQSLR